MNTTTDTLTDSALAGYAGTPNQWLRTSPMWYAHAVGAYFAASGRPKPRNVRMSRGAKIWANDMLFEVTTKPTISFCRIK